MARYLALVLALGLFASSAAFILPSQPISQNKQFRGNIDAQELPALEDGKPASGEAFAVQSLAFGALLGLVLGLGSPAFAQNMVEKARGKNAFGLVPERDRLDGVGSAYGNDGNSLERLLNKRTGSGIEKLQPTAPQYIEKSTPNKLSAGKEGDLSAYGAFPEASINKGIGDQSRTNWKYADTDVKFGETKKQFMDQRDSLVEGTIK